MWQFHPPYIFYMLQFLVICVWFKQRSHQSSSGSCRMIQTVENCFQSLSFHYILIYSSGFSFKNFPTIFPSSMEKLVFYSFLTHAFALVYCMTFNIVKFDLLLFYQLQGHSFLYFINFQRFVFEHKQILQFAMSIVQRFFTFPPYLIKKIIKPPNIINEVSPNLYQNLRDSTKQFIKGVVNKDVQYIRQVTGKALGQRVSQELQQSKQQDFQNLFNLGKYHLDSAQIFQISPYVIFGQNLRSRVESSKLFENIKPITSNRFIKFDPKLTLTQRFKQYKQKQIFGFNCLYKPLLINVSEDEKRTLDRPFMVTFQTDSVNIDPYIVDCQGVLFQDWRASGFN